MVPCDEGVVARPDEGVVARPDEGVVARPDEGVVARPLARHVEGECGASILGGASCGAAAVAWTVPRTMRRYRLR